MWEEMISIKKAKKKKRVEEKTSRGKPVFFKE